MILETSVTGSISNSYIFDISKSATPYMLIVYNIKRKEEYNFKGRIYSLKIYNDNNLSNDFILCYINSGNDYGFYDSANNKFYMKIGNKDFKAGKLSLFDGTTIVSNEENHTLYAILEKESDHNLKVIFYGKFYK